MPGSLPRRSVPGIGAVTRDHEPDHLERYGVAALATVGVGVAAVGARALSVGLPCPLLATTGIPCPACGMTRMADAVAHGELGHAVTTDPAGVVFLAVVAALAVGHLLGRTVGWRPPSGPLRLVPALLVAALGAHWATTLVTGGFVST